MKYLEKKKLAFMSIVNQIKGFVRTVSGIPPLTLPDCVDDNSLINYTIDGDSIQNGTPTPENPVEVESVGELTKNMFDYTQPKYSGYSTPIVENNSILIPAVTSNYASANFPIPNQESLCGKTLTASAYVKNQTNSKGSIRLGFFKGSTGTTYFKTTTLAAHSEKLLKVTYTVPDTIPEEGIKLCIGLYGNTSGFEGETSGYIEYSNIQVEIGDTATDYEPFGYKIPVKCSGINLFNPEEIIAKFESGDTYMDGAYTCTKIQLKPNTKYYLKTFKPKYSGYFYLSNLYGVSSSLDGTIGVNNDAANAYPRGYEKSATTDKTGCLYIGYYSLDNATRNKVLRENQIQIVEGSYTAITAPDYEPYQEPVITNIYLDEPLRRLQYTSTGYHSDYIDFEKGVVRRRIYEKFFNGSEIWNVWTASITDSTMGVYYRKDSELGTYANQKVLSGYGLSNYFRNTAAAMNTQKDSLVGYVCVNGNSNPPYIAFKVPFVAKEDWVEWLKTKYEMGEPLKVYWIWRGESMVETPISLPKLSTIKGTTIYSIDTEIQPSNMSATYYSTAKE